MPDKCLITVAGATASGKTRLGIALARHYQTEILSADSRQFYKEMAIGTAVPSEAELAAVPHHCIQHISIFDSYSVGDFEREALAILERLFSRQELVIMVGGSGLYLDAVTKGLDDFPQVSPGIRQQLTKQLEKEGIGRLQEQLRVLDPDHFAKVDLGNPRRLIRALEISLGTGLPYSSFLNQKKGSRPFRRLTLGLQADRKTLYERINQRVDQMLAEGLLDEAKALLPYKHLNALQTVGYKELFHYLEGGCDLQTAVAEIKKNSRRFAKRQDTWFRKNKEIEWLPFDAPLEQAIAIIEKFRNSPPYEN